MKCPNCGLENSETYAFCGSCGAIVLPGAQIDGKKVEQLKAAISQSVAARQLTDIFIPSWWLAAFFIMNVIVAVIFVVTILSATQHSTFDDVALLMGYFFLIAFATASSLLMGSIAYHLVKRQNDHFKREWDLRANILNLFKALSGSPERERLIFNEISPMLAAHKEAEPVREPWFWAAISGFPEISTAILSYILVSISFSEPADHVVLAFIVIIMIVASMICGLLMLYMIYFLGKTMTEHDMRWAAFTYGMVNVSKKFGISTDWLYAPRVLPEREFALYLILSIFIPFFVIYWLYTLIIDPNAHFKNQWSSEDWFVGVMDKLRY